MQPLCFHVSLANWSEVHLQRDLPVPHTPPYLFHRCLWPPVKCSVPTCSPDTLKQQTPNCFTVISNAVGNVYSTSTQILLIVCYSEISPAYSLNSDSGICSNAHAKIERKTPHPQAGLQACCRKWCKWFLFRQTHSVEHEQAEVIHSTLRDCPALHIPQQSPALTCQTKSSGSHYHQMGQWIDALFWFEFKL